MKPGTRVAGRWIVEAELGGDDEVRRFRVRDGDTLAEAVTPSLHALMRPGVRDAFTGLRLLEGPATLPTLATDVVDGVPVRVRPATRGTLAAARLTAPEAVAAAGWLAPAVLAAGGAGLGELGPEDLVVDEAGTLRFAPTGVPRVESVARLPRHRAPEGAITAEADLYGLGVTLYHAVTGAWPTEGRTPASAHGAAPDADALLAGLLSADPAARRAAVAALPAAPVTITTVAEAAGPGAAAPGGAVRTTVASPADRSTGGLPAAGGPIRTTVPSPAAAAIPLGRDLAPYAVLVPLAGLSPAALRVVAARAAADPEAVRRAAKQGATWAVDTAPTEAEANRIKARLEAAGVTGARLALTTAPKVIQLVLLAAVAGVVALVTGMFLIFGGVAALLLWLAAANLKAMFATVETRNAVQESARAALPDDAPEARVRALRRRVADAVLPSIVLSDLRTDVARLEDRLDAVRAHEAELAGASAADLQARQARVATELADVNAGLAALDTALTRALTAELEDDAPPALPAPAALPAPPDATRDTTLVPAPAHREAADAEEATDDGGPRRPPPTGVTR